MALGHLDSGLLASRSETVHLGCLKPLVRGTSVTQLWETNTLSKLSMTCPPGHAEQRRDVTVLPEGTHSCEEDGEPPAAGWRGSGQPPEEEAATPAAPAPSTEH